MHACGSHAHLQRDHRQPDRVAVRRHRPGRAGLCFVQGRAISTTGSRRWPGWSRRSSSPCRCSTSRSPPAPAATCSAARSPPCWSGPGSARSACRVVLIVQCLLFADGGLTALGAEHHQHGAASAPPPVTCSSSGAAAGAAAHPAGLGRRRLRRRRVSAWSSRRRASCWSTRSAAPATSRSATVAVAMAGVHMLIGIGEGVITALTVGDRRRRSAPTWSTRLRGAAAPGRAEPADPAPRCCGMNRTIGWFLLGGLLVALLLAGVVSNFASASPDGLDAVARGAAPSTPTAASPAAPASPSGSRTTSSTAARWPTTASAASTTPGCPPAWPGWSACWSRSPSARGVFWRSAAPPARHARAAGRRARRLTMGAGHAHPLYRAPALPGAPAAPEVKIAATRAVHGRRGGHARARRSGPSAATR